MNQKQEISSKGDKVRFQVLKSSNWPPDTPKHPSAESCIEERKHRFLDYQMLKT